MNDNSLANKNVVEARGLSLIFGEGETAVHALSDVDLTIEQGEFVSFIGPSGCGKTTLMRVIADLEKPTAGEITVHGSTPEQARLARAYGYVFQAPALYPWRNVKRNALLPLELSLAMCPAMTTLMWFLLALLVLRKSFLGNCPAACNSVSPSPALWALNLTCC